MFANANTFDAMFEVCTVLSEQLTFPELYNQANINCTLNGGVEMLVTAPSLVTMRAASEASIQKQFDFELKGKKTTYMGPAIARMLVAFGLDFINGFFQGLVGQGILTFYSQFTIKPTGDFDYYPGTITKSTSVNQNPRLPEIFENYTDSVAVFDNFATALWSAMLSDLGMASPPNAFVHTDLFQQMIHSNFSDPPSGISYSWINGTAANYVLSNMTGMQLPFDVQPTSFNAKYLCHKITWKPITSLIIDVLVATSSFFLLVWGLLNTILAYFASKSPIPC
ncbi:hypothetical protein RhiJN_16360 [Ceratobasidium sp. AG-Ba]|nr:hypothetical protein RhiJN_16360 [Ceratobasidium sp. AG-Ba]